MKDIIRQGITRLIWQIDKSLDKNDDPPTTAGNQTVKDPNFLNLEDYIRNFNCEASYFLEVNGNRTTVQRIHRGK